MVSCFIKYGMPKTDLCARTQHRRNSNGPKFKNLRRLVTYIRFTNSFVF